MKLHRTGVQILICYLGSIHHNIFFLDESRIVGWPISSTAAAATIPTSSITSVGLGASVTGVILRATSLILTALRATSRIVAAARLLRGGSDSILVLDSDA